VTFTEAALGADIKVPTIAGDDVTVRLAPGTPNGRVLRVKGRGINKNGTTGDNNASVPDKFATAIK
jgi:molecular chaperone DnaJ